MAYNWAKEIVWESKTRRTVGRRTESEESPGATEGTGHAGGQVKP